MVVVTWWNTMDRRDARGVSGEEFTPVADDA